MSRKKLKPLAREEFDTLKQEVNKQAAEYVTCGRDIRLREQIWLLLWEAGPNLFTAKHIRKFGYCPPSSLYETGEEFLAEVLSESIPEILDSYVKKYADAPGSLPFMQFFNACFIRKVRNAYVKIQRNMPQDTIIVRNPVVQVYQKAQEDTLVPDTFLIEGMVRPILGQESDGKQTWIKIEFKEHGRTVYVREKDVECRGKASIVTWDSITEPEEPVGTKPGLGISDTFDDCILSLLTLVEKLYVGAQVKRGKGFSKRYGFQLLYTEKLLGWLKRIYEEYGEFPVRIPQHEQEAISVAETDFLDYLLTDTCRTFSTIAVTPLHTKQHFRYLNSDSDEEIVIFEEDDEDNKGKKKEKEKGIAGIIYVHFLMDIKRINRTPKSITASLSDFRTEFNQQYALLLKRM